MSNVIDPFFDVFYHSSSLHVFLCVFLRFCNLCAMCMSVKHFKNTGYRLSLILLFLLFRVISSFFSFQFYSSSIAYLLPNRLNFRVKRSNFILSKTDLQLIDYWETISVSTKYSTNFLGLLQISSVLTINKIASFCKLCF